MPLVLHVFIAVAVVAYVVAVMVWALKASNAVLKLKLKPNKALDENSSLSCGTSPAIWDHTVLPATRHK